MMWSRIPLLRLIIPFVGGILLAPKLVPAAGPAMMLLLLPALLVVAGTLFYSMIFSYRSRWAYGSLIILFFFCYAALITSRKDKAGRQIQAISVAEKKTFLVRLSGPFELRERSCRGRVETIACMDSAGWTATEMEIMLYTEPDSSLPDLRAGQLLLIHARPELTRPPANPFEFNYREYLGRKRIFHTAYLKKGEWYVCLLRDSPEMIEQAGIYRNRLLEKLRLSGISDKHFGISSALLLGEDRYLADDIRDIYSRAGAMHILCVSGLHVGVIFLVLGVLFSFLRKSKFGKIILPFLLMGGIWCYALVTGLAPPVVRASCMISFIIIGNALMRQKNVYNTLSASALLMLILDPYLLFGAGFQLSYSAVLGIVSLQKPISNWFYFRYRLPAWMWSITSVSIAAQLGTLPVVLFYFHQFPLYGLITNLIVIPLSSLVIYAGFLLLLMPAASLPADGAAFLLSKLVWIMDTGVGFVESLPGGLLGGIRFDLFMALMLTGMIVFFAAFLISRLRAYFFMGLFLLLGFSLYRGADKLRLSRQEELLVYAVNGHTAVGIVQGRKLSFIADSALLASPGKLEYSIKPHWLGRGLRELRIQEPDGGQLYYPGQLRLVFWQGAFPHCNPPRDKLKTDFLVLRGRLAFGIGQVYDWFDPGIIILDASVPPWVDAEASDSLWVVREQGAFVAELQAGSPGSR